MKRLTAPNFVGWTLIASGVWWTLQLIFVSLFYIVGGAFGGMSDFSIAAATVLLLPFGFSLYYLNRNHAALLSLINLSIGIVGILMVAIPSILLIVGGITFEQSLPLVIGGHAVLGVWLFAGIWMIKSRDSLPPRLIQWGLVIGLGLASTGLLLFLSTSNPLVGGDWSEFISNPLLYPTFVLIPISVLSYPFWVFRVGRMLVLPAGP